ncbi:MAG: hypothetical protein AAGF15_07755 [Pseudomonadota bacterium]
MQVATSRDIRIDREMLQQARIQRSAAYRRSKSSPAFTNADSELKDYIQRLARHRKGRRALYIQLSALPKQLRDQHRLRIVAAFLHGMVKENQGHIFKMSGGDWVFICQDPAEKDFLGAVNKIKTLFEDDFAQARYRGEFQYTLYDLGADYEVFVNRMMSIIDQTTDDAGYDEAFEFDREEPGFDDGFGDQVPVDQVRPHGVSPLATDGTEWTKGQVRPVLKALSIAEFDRLERVTRGMDVSGLVRREQVAAVLGPAQAQTVFVSRNVPLSVLQDRVLPTVDLEADMWFAHRLRQSLDLRMIRSLDPINGGSAIATSLVVNLDCVEGMSFQLVERMRRDDPRLKIILEFRFAEVVIELDRFIRISEDLRNRGYRICVRDLSPTHFRAIDRTELRVDFEKLQFTRAMLDRMDDNDQRRLSKKVEKVGAGRVILSGCDEEAGYRFGRACGISLFSGKFIDQILANQSLG